jgi:hypothetical protein
MQAKNVREKRMCRVVFKRRLYWQNEGARTNEQVDLPCGWRIDISPIREPVFDAPQRLLNSGSIPASSQRSLHLQTTFCAAGSGITHFSRFPANGPYKLCFLTTRLYGCGLPSASIRRTSPRSSSRIAGSIFARSPTTTHTRSLGCTVFRAAASTSACFRARTRAA